MKTAIVFTEVIESWPNKAPKKSANSPDVDVKIVVLATLVFAKAKFDEYCI